MTIQSSKGRKYIPEISSPLRGDIIEMPRIISRMFRYSDFWEAH